MTVDEAIKYLKQLYPNGGHCWLDEQRIEAIGMAIAALEHEKPVSEDLKEALDEYIRDNFTVEEELYEKHGIKPENYMYSMDKGDMLAMIRHFLPKRESVSEDLEAEIKKAFLNNECSVTDAVSLSAFTRIARHFVNWQKEKVSSIVKQYADKGEKNYQESCTNDGQCSTSTSYWDGFRDCANAIKRELKD